MASLEAETFLWRRINKLGEQASFKTGSRARAGAIRYRNRDAGIYATIIVKQLAYK